MIFNKADSLKGTITVPGDKSISHRAVMLGSLAEGTTKVSNFLKGEDCLSTIRCFQQMGIEIEEKASELYIHGNGLRGLKPPTCSLDVGNSGTTMRLLSGILSAQNFNAVITGDASIQKRPMKRIITPLSKMGADIVSACNNGCAPLSIHGRPLNGISYCSPVASAQVKSCILLAGLYAKGATTVMEPYLSRNHTELMLNAFGVKTECHGTSSTVYSASKLEAAEIEVPGDISSAAYFIAAGLIVPNSEILIKNVGINPTRDGILVVCKKMGAKIELKNKKQTGGELTADILVKHSTLNGTEIRGSLIPTLIDELPVLSVLSCFANGKTVIKDAEELKVKESNRIDVMSKNLSAMGADVTPTDDGLIINGGAPLHGAEIDSGNDHRIAMSFAVASLMAEGNTTIHNADCINISYPAFYHDLNSLQH